MVVRPTKARIDEAALRHNLAVMRAATAHGCVLAVVKADAYGHGAIRVGRVLVDAGAWGLAVSLVEEGAALREAGVRGPILILGGIYPGHEDLALLHGLTPIVWEGGQLQRLRAAARRSPKNAPVSIHLKVDTGMGRLGCLPEELPAVIEAWRACSTELVVEGLMTHLACADEDDDPASDGQLQRFEAARGSLAAAGIIPRWIHAANSAATLRYRAAHYDLVRPGLAMYGVRPGGVREAFDGVGVLTLTSRVSALRELPAGHGVSYGHDTTLARATRAAIVPVGYEDGYPRRASGQAVVLVRGQRCAVLGRVTMDTLVVDVTAIPEVAVGDVVTLIGADEAARVEVADLARWAGLSTYEVLCGVSARVPRV